MFRRKTIASVIAGIAIGLAVLPLVAFAQGSMDATSTDATSTDATTPNAALTAGLKRVSIDGVGTGALAAGDCTTPAIACAVGHSCFCLTSAQTLVANQGFNKGSLTFELSVDETTIPSLALDPDLTVSTAGNCFPATGSGTIATSNGKKTVRINITGLACPTADAVAQVFFGTYFVTAAGTGSFVAGTGSFSASLTGNSARAAITGNMQ
jgi:hypothetical protein